MPATSAQSGSTFVSDATVGTLAWTNPGFAVASDNSRARALALSASEISEYEKATGFTMGVPTDAASIDGIVVTVERKKSTTGQIIVDNSVKIVKGDVISGTEKASATSWPSTEANEVYGGATDLWGLTWTVAQINASDFGVAISAKGDPSNTLDRDAEIDHITIVVHYTAGDPGPLPADTLGLTDALTRTQTVQRTLADALALTDAQVVAWGAIRASNDIFVLSDLPAISRGTTRAVADTFGLTDAVGVTEGGLTQPIADIFGLTDLPSVIRAVKRNAADTFGLTDAAVTSLGSPPPPDSVSDKAPGYVLPTGLASGM